jgi:small subunit ribosomal protein S20
LTKALKISIVAGLSGILRRFVLANTAQAKKRARQAEVHRVRNASQRTDLRTQIKKVRTAIASKDKSAAQLAFRDAAAAIDHLVGKGLVHKNAAARYKSGLNQQLRALA